MSDQSSSDSQPSMLGGHVKYVQGAVSSALGYESGEQTKQEAVQELKQAGQGSGPPSTQSSVLGTVEKAAGDLTGCGGMQQEGEQRMPPNTGSHKAGVEETSGTG